MEISGFKHVVFCAMRTKQISKNVFSFFLSYHPDLRQYKLYSIFVYLKKIHK